MFKQLFKFVLLPLFLLAISLQSVLAEEVPITVKGIATGTKNRQRDYKAAVLDAKTKAIEQAGADIKSIAQIQNYQVREKTVESSSEGLLLPGYQIMDIGYIADGTYQVVLTGKIQTKDTKINGKFQYAINIYKQGRRDEAVSKMQSIADLDDDVRMKTQALYYLYLMKLDMGKFENIEQYYQDIAALDASSSYLSKIKTTREAKKKQKDYNGQTIYCTDHTNEIADYIISNLRTYGNKKSLIYTNPNGSKDNIEFDCDNYTVCVNGNCNKLNVISRNEKSFFANLTVNDKVIYYNHIYASFYPGVGRVSAQIYFGIASKDNAITANVIPELSSNN